MKPREERGLGQHLHHAFGVQSRIADLGSRIRPQLKDLFEEWGMQATQEQGGGEVT